MQFILDIINLDDSKIILDIGSWHLDQAIELSSIFPNSEIHAFEPVPLSYQDCLNKSFLHKNIKVEYRNDQTYIYFNKKLKEIK